MDVIDGRYDPETLERLIQVPHGLQHAETGLICVENTYDLNAGTVVDPDNLAEVRSVADRHGLPIYMDGARIFNAAVALGVPADHITRHVDAVQFCLTKGLSCPLGAVIAGSGEFIDRARKMRQRLGGGMRQAGLIASPGIYALSHLVDRLADDHANAKRLAQGLSKVPALAVDANDVETNIVCPTIVDDQWNSDQLVKAASDNGIKVKRIDERRVRLITHLGIAEEHVDHVVSVITKIFDSSVQTAS